MTRHHLCFFLDFVFPPIFLFFDFFIFIFQKLFSNFNLVLNILFDEKMNHDENDIRKASNKIVNPSSFSKRTGKLRDIIERRKALIKGSHVVSEPAINDDGIDEKSEKNERADDCYIVREDFDALDYPGENRYARLRKACRGKVFETYWSAEPQLKRRRFTPPIILRENYEDYQLDCDIPDHPEEEMSQESDDGIWGPWEEKRKNRDDFD